jgi:hypothetical protein
MAACILTFLNCRFRYRGRAHTNFQSLASASLMSTSRKIRESTGADLNSVGATDKSDQEGVFRSGICRSSIWPKVVPCPRFITPCDL